MPVDRAQPTPTLDPRVQRTRAALRTAVLELTATRRIEDISVSELAAAAGVNRSSFYRNADSPEALLRDALYEDFDVWRSSVLGTLPLGEPMREAWRQASLRIAHHVDRHRGVYETGLGDPELPSAALLRITTSHFESSIEQYLEAHPSVLPPADDGAEPLPATAYARYIGSGTVGLIRAWLETPQPRSAQAYARTTLAILPSWLFDLPS
jgi:AcrR family transcriptional regulator